MPADERRAAILAATEPLVMAYGRDVSTRQIAEAAGIAEGTIFRVFPNKDALIDEIIEDALDLEPTITALTGIEASLGLETRLERAVTILVTRLRRVIGLFTAFRHRHGPPDGAEQDPERRRRADNARLAAALAGVIGSDADRLRLPVEQAADLIRALTFSLTHPLIGASFPTDPAVIVDTLLHGILNPTTQESRPC